MLRNVLAAALRHLVRSRLYTAVSVLGLAVGLCVALLVALVIHNQYSYDHDVPGHERTYLALVSGNLPGRKPFYTTAGTEPSLATLLQAKFPQVEGVTRVLDRPAEVQRDGRSERETVYWVDANFPAVLPLPGYAGDVAAALRTADGLVLSRSYARRFFGRDAPIGEILLVDNHPMVVRAVIKDPRPNATHAMRNIIAAGIAGFSPLRAADNEAAKVEALRQRSGANMNIVGTTWLTTYIRLKSGANLRSLKRQMQQITPPPSGGFGPAQWPELVPLDRINTHEGLHPGFRSRMAILAILGAVVLLIAAVNFANLQTARATLRAKEVAIRGLVGATRSMLIAQFLGEAMIHAAAATLLAAALAEWLLPHVNAFLDTGAVLDYRIEPWLIAALAAVTLLFSLIAGAWPAFAQSRFRPAVALRGGVALIASGARVRQVLVTLQFALLIALVLCAGVVNRQHEFALTEAVRVDHDEVLLVSAPSNSALFADELRKLPGVRNVTRASSGLMGAAGFGGSPGPTDVTLRDRDGRLISVDGVEVDFDLFDFYGVRPLAGQLPVAGASSRRVATGLAEVAINEAAARKFGFASPAEAVGKDLLQPGIPQVSIPPHRSRVLAAVPDFSMGSVQQPIQPTIYYQPTHQTNERQPDLVSVRLSGHDIPETLAAIDKLWSSTGNAVVGGAAQSGPTRMFLDQYFQRSYRSMLRQSQAFGLCALIAIILACVGLFALTAATAERRTKEIGIRKAMGADTGDVLKLLLWQFSKPVVWANLIAWPLAGYLMQRWLAGFAYHIDLPLWLFPATAFVALLIALATVTTQSLAVARSKPVTALRYE